MWHSPAATAALAAVVSVDVPSEPPLQPHVADPSTPSLPLARPGVIATSCTAPCATATSSCWVHITVAVGAGASAAAAASHAGARTTTDAGSRGPHRCRCSGHCRFHGPHNRCGPSSSGSGRCKPHGSRRCLRRHHGLCGGLHYSLTHGLPSSFSHGRTPPYHGLATPLRRGRVGWRRPGCCPPCGQV